MLRCLSSWAGRTQSNNGRSWRPSSFCSLSTSRRTSSCAVTATGVLVVNYVPASCATRMTCRNWGSARRRVCCMALKARGPSCRRPKRICGQSRGCGLGRDWVPVRARELAPEWLADAESPCLERGDPAGNHGGVSRLVELQRRVQEESERNSHAARLLNRTTMVCCRRSN